MSTTRYSAPSATDREAYILPPGLLTPNQRRPNDGTTANSQQETPNFQVTTNGNGLTTLPFLYLRVSLRLRSGQAVDKSRCRCRSLGYWKFPAGCWMFASRRSPLSFTSPVMGEEQKEGATDRPLPQSAAPSPHRFNLISSGVGDAPGGHHRHRLRLPPNNRLCSGG